MYDSQYYDSDQSIISDSSIDIEEIVMDLNSTFNDSDSDSEYDSKSEYDSDNSYNSDLYSYNEYDEINIRDSQHFYREKIDQQYYIGMCDYISPTNTLLMSTTISTPMYFQLSYRSCYRYLYYYGITNQFRPFTPTIDIMQLNIKPDGTYSVLLKTFWLKIIQRKWKKIYKQRIEVIRQRMKIHSLKYKEINGNWPSSISYLPTLYGLMVN